MDDQPVGQVYRHPEWKRIYDGIATSIEIGRLLTYAELSAIGGVDVRSLRGRQQFLRCRDEVLKNHGWWFANVRGKGYRVVHPNEQPGCALHLVVLGQKRIRKGGKVNGCARVELMAAEVAKMSADIQVRQAMLDKQLSSFVKEVRKQIGATEQKRLPTPALDKLKAG